MKKFLSLALALMMVLSLSAGAMAEEENAVLKVGIVQYMQHPALDAAYEGFVAALAEAGFVEGENLEIDYQNAQGDQSNLGSIADRFIGNNVDLILAIATPAAQSMAAKTEDIAIFGTAITDYVAAGLVESNEAPGYNVTGTSDLASIKDQIGMIKTFCPDAKTVGVLYTSSEVNSVTQATEAKACIEAAGMTYVEKTVTNGSEVQQATESIVRQCDVIYIPTDNVFANAMPIVYGVTVDSKTPVFCGEENMVKQGGFATMGINYYNLGYQTGEMAIRWLETDGLDTAEMPVEWQASFGYTINKTVADEIGVAIPEDLAQYAIEMDAAQ